MPRRNLDISESARRDLDAAFDYTIDRWGFDQAYEYSEDLLSCIEHLREFPELGRDRSWIHEDLRSLVVAHHRILYRVFDDRVLIHRVIHQRVDLGEALADLNEAPE